MSTTGRDLLLLVGLVLAVYLPKALPLILMRDRISPAVQRWLKYVAPAVLSAMVAGMIAAPDGHLITPGWTQLPYLATLVVAVATRRMFVAVGSGLVVLLVLVLAGKWA